MGNGKEGQLGIRNIINENPKKKFCQKPTKILNSIKTMCCGAKYALAISFNNEVYCWGENENGQLGINYGEDMFDNDDETKIRETVDIIFEEGLIRKITSQCLCLVLIL